MPKKTVSMEALKSFVRQEGPRYLKQKNITSIGIGYKIKDGKPTDELAIQFTVGRKVAPEGLEAIGATHLPKSITIGGVEVPTDVIERSYGAHPREVHLKEKLDEKSARRTVADPIVPGVSIGHPTVSAGTAGCVVYDAQTGAPYILSNWHVLNGSKGAVGDSIVQPGSYDDDRIDRNVVGRLARSYLGIAGDCALASIDQRPLDPTILGLNVAIRRIGEPELGDRVVKSGRTTGVTYGMVTRIHVTVNMDYDNERVEQIGCFEIHPDPDHPAVGGQISMGGDSGAVWLSVDGDKPSDMMLGLHFAGETGDEPDHALACYAASVFEKLGIQPKKSAKPARALEAVKGYSPTFIGPPIPLPSPSDSEVGNDLLVVQGSSVIDYMHFSLAMSHSRHFARWVAWNIDGSSTRRLSRSGISFKKDPNVPANAQVGNELYTNNVLDRGHIARRADIVWGTLAEAQRANRDSFFYTNITPQHESFNQSEANGIWGQLEDAIFADVDVNDLRISVMGGPIFSEIDPTYRGIGLPKQFWKVIFFRESGDDTIKAKGYVLTQADLLNQLEVLELPEFFVYEVPVSRIGEMTGLSLPDGAMPELAGQKKPRETEAEVVGKGTIRRITSLRDVVRRLPASGS